MVNNNKPLIIGNWKMNGLVSEATKLTQSLLASMPDKAEIVLCPPFTLLSHLQKIIQNSGLKLGAQDCHEQSKGAFTGSVSAAMLQDVGCEYVLIGHSERRTLHHEVSSLVASKAKAAYEASLKAVICIGETLEQYEAGQTIEIVQQQLQESIPQSAHADNTVIAYEPVWAIGTGLVPTLQQIQEVHQAIQQKIEALFPNSSTPWKILYGGSVKPQNAAEILALPSVNGALVGGASLDNDQFLAIINATHVTNEPIPMNNKATITS